MACQLVQEEVNNVPDMADDRTDTDRVNWLLCYINSALVDGHVPDLTTVIEVLLFQGQYGHCMLQIHTYESIATAWTG